MEFILPPTEEPFGPSCASCELFADSKCLGVSTVRVVIGTSQTLEEATLNGSEIDLSVFQQPSVRRSFRILERALRYCPGPGNDGRGDFRKSNDRLSGYNSAIIINTALTQASLGYAKDGPQRLTSSGHSFTPHETYQEDGNSGQRA